MQGFPAFITEEPAVFDQQCVFGNRVPQSRHQRLLTVTPTPVDEGGFHVASQFHQADLAELGERRFAPASFRSAEALVGLAVRQIQDRAVDAHQSHPAVKGARRLGRCQRTNHFDDAVA